jgi:two-component system, OmpR family, sensor histidine kinase KdpD
MKQEDRRSGPEHAAARLDVRGWRGYALAVALVAAMTVLGVIIDAFVAPANLVMLYLVAVMIAAIYLGRKPSILAALLSVLVFDFFLVPPHHTLAVADTQYLLTFAGLLIVSLVISSLTGQARDQAAAAQRREREAVALYELSRDLSAAEEQDAIVAATVAHVCSTFDRDVVIFLPVAGGKLEQAAASFDRPLDAEGQQVAEWVFGHAQPAGRGTPTFASATVWCLPLLTPRGAVGVLSIARQADEPLLSADERRLMETFAGQAALAIERSQLAEQARQARLLEATEKLYKALLNSVSHDLRTPLVTITGAFSTLETAGSRLDEDTRTSLARTGREEAERLNRLVGDLLDMTRIEAGALKLTEEPADVSEAIGVVLDRLTGPLRDYTVQVNVPADLPPVPMDMPLIVQALVNIVDNATKYTPAGTCIEISAALVADGVQIEVRDQGAGVPTADLPHIFDRFYRASGRARLPGGVKGTGLGLSISKGIVEAHGGSIRAANRPGGGTMISIVLPLEPNALVRR